MGGARETRFLDIWEIDTLVNILLIWALPLSFNRNAPVYSYTVDKSWGAEGWEKNSTSTKPG